MPTPTPPQGMAARPWPRSFLLCASSSMEKKHWRKWLMMMIIIITFINIVIIIIKFHDHDHDYTVMFIYLFIYSFFFYIYIICTLNVHIPVLVTISCWSPPLPHVPRTSNAWIIRAVEPFLMSWQARYWMYWTRGADHLQKPRGKWWSLVVTTICFIGLVLGKIYRKPWFLPSNIGLSCKFSHHPILWMLGMIP